MIAISKPTLKTIALAAAVGGITAAVWAAFTKRNIEATYRAGAADLRNELARSGSALRAEIATLAGDSAIQAVRDELADFGVTAGMLADLQTAIEAAESVRSAARRAGVAVNTYLARIRA